MAALTKDKHIAVIGAGAMGRGIAQVAATAGHPVLLFDSNGEAVTAALADLDKGLTRLVGKGKITDDARLKILSNIKAANQLSDLAGSALVIEAIVEDLEIKQSLFKQLEQICGDQCLLATNTSSISVTAIGAALEHPGRLVGMHFFNPAQIMKLVEIIPGQASDDAAAATLLDTAISWGKKAVFAKSTPGFIVNRVARPFYGEAWRLLEEGIADAVSIDTAMTEAAGFRMGPFALMDLIGHDVNYAVTSTVYEACYQDPRYRPSLMQRELTLAGHLGRKTGRGIYQYGDDETANEAAFAEPEPAPGKVLVGADLESSGKLSNRIQSGKIATEASEKSGFILIENIHIALTDGRSATQRSVDDGIKDLILFDLTKDYETASVITLTKADQTSDQAIGKAIGLFQALGFKVLVCDDGPGLIAMRTVAMLANEAADAVGWSIATAEAVDTAMTMGVNYPIGPLSYAEKIGLPHILKVVENLNRHYGEDRYRPSPLLRRKVLSGGSFHD